MSGDITQCQRLLRALRQYPMTSLDIINGLGILRPASRVHELRLSGVDIHTEMVKVKNRYGEECCVARYTLLK